ncbi:MAG: Gfo/Idh/MocA family oxidoreductase [Candidatus Nealsonbacteria bacterium]
MKVKIFGAGSIGNHLAQASRRMGWEVVVVDPDKSALERMKSEIYPTRYGAWDENIKLFTPDIAPKGGFDVIFLGTPPHVRMQLAKEVLAEEPKILQMEKPICTPDLLGVEDFLAELEKHETKVVTGYDHAVSEVTEVAENILNSGQLGDTQVLDVEFRENWKGIFKAHPWLSGPQDSYLGFWQKGGGASGEHSHATNLWQHLAHQMDLGRVNKVSAVMQMVKTNEVDYDQSCFIHLITDKGFVGRVVQDVVTDPVKKSARIQCKEGFLELVVGYDSEGDAVLHRKSEGEIEKELVKKKRPDDFHRETLHIQDILDGKVKVEDSPISLWRGLDTMMVIAAAHKSYKEERTVTIDYTQGYNLSALK